MSLMPMGPRACWPSVCWTSCKTIRRGAQAASSRAASESEPLSVTATSCKALAIDAGLMRGNAVHPPFAN